MEKILQNLGIKHGTDKSSVHKFNGRTFLDIYEKYFFQFKEKEITIVEIGVLNGASLNLWKEYFTNSKIIGIDIDPSKKKYIQDRIEVFIGSQDSDNLISEIKDKYPDGIDIVIDDGSHINSLTISSFNLLFSHLKKGGIYIIEDTHCTYGTDFWPHFINAVGNWPGMNLNDPSLNFDNKRDDIDVFFKEKIKKMDSLDGEIRAIHFYPETVVIEKII
jgi:hypothetical protein